MKLVAEADKETTGEKRGSVDVGGLEAMNFSKEAKVWISSLAEGAVKVSLGARSVSVGVELLEG